MKKVILTWACSAVALGLAAAVVPGIRVEGSNAVVTVAAMAVVLGLVNAVVKPILKLLTGGLIVVTLGLFLLVINAVALWLSSLVAVNWLGVGFHVDGFLPALLGSVIVSVVTFALSLVADRLD